ncbi:MAG: S8 family serine peptidase [Lachnospiraceae bacterium]|nr:S8 family serine peptidase [Lachnospiraceae bacterium]
MESGKIDPGFMLALTLPEELRNDLGSLENGFNRENRQWEMLVKYHGNLAMEQEKIPFRLEELSNGFGIVFINEDDIMEFATLPQIDYIEQPKRVWFSVNEGVAESCISTLQRNDRDIFSENLEMIGRENLYGKGVLIAIIDSSIDYRHPDFRNLDGSTRIMALWDQTISSEELNKQDSSFLYAPPEGFYLGTLFTEEMINMALQQENVQEQRKIVPTVDYSGHGTHVAGIACGNGRVNDGRYRGVAPLSSILVVKLGDLEGVSFPRTTRLLEAIEFSIRFGEERGMPVVVNLSFGNNYGPHTGQDIVSEYINQIALRWKNNICVGTGNEGNTGRHVEGKLETGTEKEIELVIAGVETGFNVQIWKNYQDDFDIEIISPNNQSIILQNNENRILFESFGNTILAINYGTPSPFQILQEIYIEWIPREEYILSGIWRFRLLGKNIKAGRYDFWLPAGNLIQAQTKFLRPSPETTLTIPSAANRVISVGAYNGNTEELAPFSGRGFTRNNQIKPDIVAPGVDIMSTAPNNSYAIRSGTSMATPFVSGSVALLMEWGAGVIIRLGKVRINVPWLNGYDSITV